MAYQDEFMEDSYLLIRFFAEGRFERSHMGPMLENAEMYNQRAIRIAIAAQEKKRREAEGKGEFITLVELEFRQPREITAQPTAEQRLSQRDGPDDELLEKLGAASRRLSIVRSVDPQSYRVLEAYFGDVGVKWAGTKDGRITALLGLTQTGRAVLDGDKRKQRGAKLEVSDAKRMENLVWHSSDNAVVAKKISEARMEAMALIRRATDVWLASKSAGERKHRKAGP